MDDGFISYSTRPDGERYFTNADMARMVETGLIDPDDRWELIRGAWFEMGSEGFEHWNLRSALLEEMILQLGRNSGYRASTEGSIYLSRDTEVRPDLIVCRSDVTTNELTGADIALIAEVIKTSQRRDRELKLPVYAVAGVPEVWLIDLDNQAIEVFRAPNRSEGTYISSEALAFRATVSPSAFPQVSLRLSDLV